MTMRALTLWQPWADAVVRGGKDVENRRNLLPPADLLTPAPPWPEEETNRPLLAIHASQTYSMGAWSFPPGAEVPRRDEVALGAVIGVARVRGALDLRVPSRPRVVGAESLDRRAYSALASLSESRWWLGPIGWLLADRRALRRPVPCPGRLGCWRLPADVEAEVRREIPVW